MQKEKMFTDAFESFDHVFFYNQNFFVTVVDGNKAVYLTRLQFFRLIKPSLTETLNIIL
jgi:hypothetical protein